MKLKNRKGKLISFKNKKSLISKIDILKHLTKNNPTKELAGKIKSLLASETFASLLIEGEISSRRSINKSFKNGTASKLLIGKEKEIIEDFIGAYAFAAKAKEFNLSNLFTLYNLVSRNGIDESDKLNDGMMHRHEPVYIDSNQKVGSFEGFESKDISNALNDLFVYLKDSEDDLFLKAVIGHVYFEMIHPYFDFNGRTGRFLPMWLFSNNGRRNEMMYFATAMGNYRSQYLALFNKYIDHRTYEVNLDKLIGGMIDLLILNQNQYIWIKKLENKYLDLTNKSFSPIQKDFIWALMIKSEISKDNKGWFKLTKSDKDFIELELKGPLFSKETTKLKDSGIIKISDDKPRKYHLNNYELFK